MTRAPHYPLNAEFYPATLSVCGQNCLPNQQLSITKTKPPKAETFGGLNNMPGSVLLSHGETPHYHRRYAFSLLSSEWIQVVPTRYGRQANWLSV